MNTIPSPQSAIGASRGGAAIKILLVLVGLIAFIALVGGCQAKTQYNAIVDREAVVEAKWSEINNQYKRRFDLVPQLVSTVKGAADFEQSTIIAVTEARASVGRVQAPAEVLDDPQAAQEFLRAQQGLGSALSRLLVVSERYPELRATQNFLSLQDQLEGTENRIAVARRDYIDAVQGYNVTVKKFPGNLIAGMFGYEKLPQLEFEDEGLTDAPAIDFGGK